MAMRAVSAEERRELAGRLLAASREPGLNWGVLLGLLDASSKRDAVERLALLVYVGAAAAEPPASGLALIVEDNLRLLDRNLQLECELAAVKAKLGRAARIARDLKGSAGGMYAAHRDRPRAAE